jgi:hypothetical protein
MVATAIACAAVAALAFAGCGGGSDTTTAGASGASGASGGTPLSQDEFVSQANAACKEANDKIVALKAASSSDLKQLGVMVAQEIIVNEDTLASLTAITPPSDLQAQYNQLLSTAKAQLALANQFVDAAATNDTAKANAVIQKAQSLQGKSDSAAKALGLTECAKDASPQG